jgi:hypothetical protein
VLARHGLIPALLPREHLPNAYSLYATTGEVAAIGGPALGGLVLARFGVAPIYFADAASYLAVIGALLAMRHRGAAPAAARIDFRAALDGLRFIWRTPLILSTMLLDAVATFFAGSLLLMPLYADRILHVGPRGLGLLYAAQPAGSLVAAAALSLLPADRRQGRAVLLSIVVYGVAITGFGVSPWLLPSLLLLAISGAADTVSMVVRQTLRNLLTPDELRGRMTSVNMIFFIGGPQLGEFEAGVVARLVGPRFSVASGGILCIVVAIVAAIAVPSLRSLSTENQRASEPT